jgi:hypothetical protein
MKIAVCLSGQPRTWDIGVPYLLQFFSSDIHDYYFFGHAWDENDYRNNFKEKLDAHDLKMELLKKIPFDGLIIDHYDDNNFNNLLEIELPNPCANGIENAARYKTPTAWRGMTKSIMKANFLKQKYEHDNDMTFDVVVRTRFDICYGLGSRFDRYLPKMVDPLSLYADLSRMANDFNSLHAVDVFYFGASHVMDLIDTFHKVYHNGDFFELTDSTFNDPNCKIMGLGTLLVKWCAIKNLRIRETEFWDKIIIRPTVKNKSYPGNFNEINQEYRNWNPNDPV